MKDKPLKIAVKIECDKCSGTGLLPLLGGLNNAYVCDICKGKGWINQTIKLRSKRKETKLYKKVRVGSYETDYMDWFLNNKKSSKKGYFYQTPRDIKKMLKKRGWSNGDIKNAVKDPLTYGQENI